MRIWQFYRRRVGGGAAPFPPAAVSVISGTSERFYHLAAWSGPGEGLVGRRWCGRRDAPAGLRFAVVSMAGFSPCAELIDSASASRRATWSSEEGRQRSKPGPVKVQPI